MARAPEKDLYSILGVAPDATGEEIREAYLSRARVVHPDRFDAQRQSQDWKKANAMLADLNEAYSILCDPSTRAKYNELSAGKQRRDSPPPPPRPRRERPEPPPPPAFELGELTPGQAAFGSLPKSVQERLLKRQQNTGEDQLQIKLSSALWNYVFILVLLCWYWYLFADADGAKWKSDTLLWYLGLEAPDRF
jgi:curved DNA-binding protein CbpA